MVDPAKAIYDSLNNEADLQKLLSQQVENLYIDFKRKKDHNALTVDPGLQENLSRGVSGFANAAGGVLVIGVDSRRGKSPSIMPIVPYVEFEQEINTYLPRSTSFLVQGITVKSVPIGGGGGVVLIYIPKSDLAPHCSLKDKKYYQRNGDSFCAMEHYQIADLFGKRHQPVLVPSLLIRREDPVRNKLIATIGIENFGRAIARFPLIKIIETSGFEMDVYGLNGSGTFGLPRYFNFKTYRGGVDDVVHPGTSLDINRMNRGFVVDKNGALADSFHELVLSGEIVADEFPLRNWLIRLERQQIQDLLASDPSQQQSVKVIGELR